MMCSVNRKTEKNQNNKPTTQIMETGSGKLQKAFAKHRSMMPRDV